MKEPNMKKRQLAVMTLAILAVFGLSGTTPAQTQQSAEELAKKLANPVASLISFPLENNFDFNYKGAEIDGGYRWLMNVQPVIPFSLSKNWNIISRTILPVIEQGNVYGPGDVQTGLGDTLQSLFFSPAAPSKKLGLIWGVGPVILIPTSTDDLLGAGKWALGPTIVVLKQTGPWTVGMLANQLWQVGGKETPEEPTIVNSMFLQPFVARAYKGGFSWVLNTEFTRNWAADNSSGIINLVFQQVTKALGQQVQFGLGPRIWYGDAPVRARWGIRAKLVFLWPK
jgi:hypothetical protein